MDIDQNVGNWLVLNWDRIPKDIKLLTIGNLDEKERFAFCQANRKISEFCRQYKLTADDKAIESNPTGVLIDTRRKQADLIKRGFETVFSVVMNEKDSDSDDDDDNIRSDNIPELKNIEVLELRFGLNQGTEYYIQHGHDIWETRVHLQMKGLPPFQESMIDFVLIATEPPYDGITRFEAFPYYSQQDLMNILYEISAFAEQLKPILDESMFSALLETRRVILPYNLVLLCRLPCP